MRYRFRHPDVRDIEFFYNDELPLIVQKKHGDEIENISLIYKNVNAEDFFYYLIKSKCIHIEDRSIGFALIDEQRFEVTKPYDCKSAVHKLLGIRNENPLIIASRSRYLWLLTDEEMKYTSSDPKAVLSSTHTQIFATTPLPGNDRWELKKIDLESSASGCTPATTRANLPGLERTDFCEIEASFKKRKSNFESKIQGEKDTFKKVTNLSISENVESYSEESKQYDTKFHLKKDHFQSRIRNGKSDK